jgi:TonB family protein
MAKGAIFLVSLILHIAGFSVVLHLKFSYKIYDLKQKSVSAFIVPKEKIVAPRRDGLAAGIPAGEDLGEKEIAGGEGSGAGRAAVGQKPAESQFASGAQAGRPGGAAPAVQSPFEVKGEIKESRNFSSGFGLLIPPKSKLDLTKTKGSLEDSYLPRDKYQVRSDIDFTRYLFPGTGISGTTGGGGRPGRPGKKGAQAFIGGAAPSNVQKYDFSPWANAVMNRIQKNWSIAAPGDFAWKGEVGITVVIGKNGNLTLIEVIASSKIDALDQAAVRALELSLPFPALPVDFPNSSLEVYFIFQYGY